MRIEASKDDVADLKRRNTIRTIQKYQESQDKLDGDKTKAGKKTKPDTAQSADAKPISSIRVQATDAQAAKHVEERSEATVKKAHQGQKAGENWQAFADRKSTVSPEALKLEAEKKIEAKHDEQKVISARELLNERAKNDKKIPC